MWFSSAIGVETELGHLLLHLDLLSVQGQQQPQTVGLQTSRCSGSSPSSLSSYRTRQTPLAPAGRVTVQPSGPFTGFTLGPKRRSIRLPGIVKGPAWASPALRLWTTSTRSLPDCRTKARTGELRSPGVRKLKSPFFRAAEACRTWISLR